MQMYRQGDVLVVLMENEIPSDAREVSGRIILAEGEATGHAHEVKTKGAKLFDRAGERFLMLTRNSILSHQEHAPITLPAGRYKVVQQREYSPEAIRNVAD